MYNNTEESDEVSEEEKRPEGNSQEGNEKSMSDISDKPDEEGNDDEEVHNEAENERTRAQDEDLMNNVDQGGPQDGQKKRCP